MIKWKDVTLPEEWTLDEVQPQPPPQHVLSDTNFITQTRDGTVNISFDRQSRNLAEPIHLGLLLVNPLLNLFLQKVCLGEILN